MDPPSRKYLQIKPYGELSVLDSLNELSSLTEIKTLKNKNLLELNQLAGILSSCSGVLRTS